MVTMCETSREHSDARSPHNESRSWCSGRSEATGMTGPDHDPLRGVAPESRQPPFLRHALSAYHSPSDKNPTIQAGQLSMPGPIP